MTQHYRDYFWKNGRPRGKGVTQDLTGETFRIVSDPYFRWITVERYVDSRFERIVYDSQKLNFRKLDPNEQTAWQRVTIKESDAMAECLIRNHDDRVIYIEVHSFEKDVCRKCELHSPNRELLSRHEINYTALGDAFDGVTLYDATGRTVMEKRYALSEDGSFEELLSENWEVTPGIMPGGVSADRTGSC